MKGNRPAYYKEHANKIIPINPLSLIVSSLHIRSHVTTFSNYVHSTEKYLYYSNNYFSLECTLGTKARMLD